MQPFWQLMRENIIIEGSLALGLAAGVLYLAIAGQPIPEALALGFGAVMGHFFGAQKYKAAVDIARGRMK